MPKTEYKDKPPAFQFYARDFDMGTAEMTLGEVGAYTRLLCFEWDNGSLPDNLVKLASIARCSPEEFEQVWPAVKEKFVKNGNGRWINLKMEKVRKEQEEYRQKQSEAGKKGVEAKKEKGIYPFNQQDEIKQPLESEPSEASSDPSSQNQALQSSSSTPTSPSTTSSEKKSSDEAGASSHPPDCPHEKIIALWHEKLPELPQIKVWTGQRQQHLKTRWREDSERWTLEWWDGLFELVRASPFLMGGVPGKNGRPPFMASLPWLVMPENFAKVIEGFYLDRRETRLSEKAQGSLESGKRWIQRKRDEDAKE